MAILPNDRVINVERHCLQNNGILPAGIHTLSGFAQLAKALGLTTGKVPVGLKKYYRPTVASGHFNLRWTNGRGIITDTVANIGAMFSKCSATVPKNIGLKNQMTLVFDGK